MDPKRTYPPDRANPRPRQITPWRLGRGCVLAALLGALIWPAAFVRAEDEPAAEPGDEARPAPTVAVIQGTNVNVRVGPRPGGRPVVRLDDGAVVLILRRLHGWLEVQVPAGVTAAVAGRYVEPVGRDAVRVTASRLNMRLAPMVEGQPAPASFADRLTRGDVLPLVRREGDWAWVMAPETTRVYVSDRFVREVGPVDKHTALVARARARRAAQLQKLAAERAEAIARASGAKLRGAIGTAQQALYKLRLARGIDRAPVVEVITALERVIEVCTESPVAVRKLARAVREDLEAELEMRVARKDAEVARLRGLTPPAERSAAPKVAERTARGVIRWEAAPGWRNGGEWVLWVEDEPRYVLQLTTGLPRPLPDLKGNADQGARTVVGRQPGTRVFGLPVIEIRRITK